MSFTASALVLTWVALLLLSLVVAGLVRQIHELQQAAPPGTDRRGPRGRLGAVVPPVPGIDTSAVRLLLLLDADCDACTILLDGVRSTLSPTVLRTGVALLYADEIDPRAARLGAALAGDAGGVFDAVGATALPYGVALGGDGRVAAAGPVGAVSQLMPLLSAAGLDRTAQSHDHTAHDVHPEVTR